MAYEYKSDYVRERAASADKHLKALVEMQPLWEEFAKTHAELRRAEEELDARTQAWCVLGPLTLHVCARVADARGFKRGIQTWACHRGASGETA